MSINWKNWMPKYGKLKVYAVVEICCYYLHCLNFFKVCTFPCYYFTRRKGSARTEDDLDLVSNKYMIHIFSGTISNVRCLKYYIYSLEIIKWCFPRIFFHWGVLALLTFLNLSRANVSVQSVCWFHKAFLCFLQACKEDPAPCHAFQSLRINVWALAEKFLAPSWGIPQRTVMLKSLPLTGLELCKVLVCPSCWGSFCHLHN